MKHVAKTIIASAVVLQISCGPATMPLDEVADNISVEHANTLSQTPWYTRSELHHGSMYQWRKASYREKRAACADYLMALQMQGMLNNNEFSTIASIDGFKPFAEALVVTVDDNLLLAKALANTEDTALTQQVVAKEVLRAAGQLGYLSTTAHLPEQTLVN